MGVYIPNVQKPKKCGECPCYYYEYKECNALGGIRVNGEATPPNDCQAIEVKPHGRLIDADALEKSIREDERWVMSNKGDDEKTLMTGYQCAYSRSRVMIHHAPTIIEGVYRKQDHCFHCGYYGKIDCTDECRSVKEREEKSDG